MLVQNDFRTCHGVGLVTRRVCPVQWWMNRGLLVDRLDYCPLGQQRNALLNVRNALLDVRNDLLNVLVRR